MEQLALWFYLKEFYKNYRQYENEEYKKIGIHGHPKEILEKLIEEFVKETDENAGRFFGEDPKYYDFGSEINGKSKIAITSLYPIDRPLLVKVKDKGVDVLISGGLDSFAILAAKELRINVYDLDHYRMKSPAC